MDVFRGSGVVDSSIEKDWAALLGFLGITGGGPKGEYAPTGIFFAGTGGGVGFAESS